MCLPPENRLSTGFVIAGAYADKVRRTLFAQAKQLNVETQEVVRAAAELNRILFEILVNRLGIDKGDVVRVRVDYEVKDGKIHWNYDSLQIEAFRRISDEEVAKKVSEVISRVSEILASQVTAREREFIGEEAKGPAGMLGEIGVREAKFLGENVLGEKVIALKDDRGKTIGVVVTNTIGGETILDAIVIKPSGEPVRVVAKHSGSIEELEDLSRLNSVLESGEVRSVTKEAARRILKEKLEGLA